MKFDWEDMDGMHRPYWAIAEVICYIIITAIILIALLSN